MSNEPCVTTSQPSHHIRISNSVGNIHSVVIQLKALKARLNNEPQAGCEDNVKASEPSFIDVLTHTPDSIIAACNEANQILAEIEEMLF